MRWLKTELRALLEYLLLPGLAALLPWPWAFALFRRLARWPWLYAPEWRPALAAASVLLPVADAVDWAWRYRLLRLIDHADFWLSRTRGESWMRRHLHQEGEWPAPGEPFVGVFFHWGPGLWPVRALRAAGHRCAVLAARFSRRSMGGAWLGYRYGAARLDELARVAGRPLIYAPGSTARALAVLAEGDCVLGAPDTPPTETRAVVPVRLFGRPARYAEGLVRIARRAGVPVLVLCFPPDLETGRRRVRVLGSFDSADPALLQRLVDLWQERLVEAPWAFTLWPMFDSFFTPPARHENG